MGNIAPFSYVTIYILKSENTPHLKLIMTASFTTDTSIIYFACLPTEKQNWTISEAT